MKLVNDVKTFGKNNGAELLAVAAIFSAWGAIWTAYKAGPKAERVLEAKRKDLEDTDPEDKATKRTITWELIREMTPIVSVPIMLGAMSTGCIIGSHAINSKKIATLASAYTMASTALYEHKDKVKELFGEGKAQQVREAISKDHLEKAEVPKDENSVIVTGLGTSLCYDEYTDRYFYSSAEAIGNAIVKCSYELLNDMWVPLNDFYQELNLKPCKMGYDLGWSVDGLDHNKIPIYYTAILTDDNRPCLCIQFDVSLRESFKNY